MSRRRYISTDISTDKRIAQLAKEYGDFAALLYTWMVPHAADDCTITKDPEELLMLVTPGFRWKEVDDITAAIDGMMALGLLLEEPDGYYFPPTSFYKYQTYVHDDRRRKSPQIAEEQRETPQIIASIKHSLSLSVSPSSSPSLIEESAPADAALPTEPEPAVEIDPGGPAEKPKRSRSHSLKEAEDEIPRFREEHPHINVLEEWQKFTNYLKARSKKYTDYIAAFENWLLNAEKYERERLQTAGRSTGGRSRGAIAGPDMAGWERFAAGQD